MSDLEIITFGCRLNTFESEIMRRHARDAALGETVIVHTCAVTSEAERQARQAIRRTRRDRPDARIVVTGCSAQISAERYRAMPEVDRVVGNAEKLEPSTWRELNARTSSAGTDIMATRLTASHLVDGIEGRSRAFVQIQNGCDHRCTFCVIPFGRGPSRSIEPDRVIDQVRLLIARNYQEVVVTGVDITSYGKDLPGTPTVGQLLKMILQAAPDLRRLRLSSIDPAEVDHDLRDLIAEEPRLMPHLHLSIQAGDDMVLKRMKRRHSRNDVIELCDELRRLRPDIVFGADLIAGFPTETETMHKNSLGIVEEAQLTHLHVFPYSERPGTPASRMPSVPKVKRKERAAALRSLGERRLADYLNTRVGGREKVLIERSRAGHTEGFAICTFTDEAVLQPGTIIDAKIDSAHDGMLVGSVAA